MKMSKKVLLSTTSAIALTTGVVVVASNFSDTQTSQINNVLTSNKASRTVSGNEGQKSALISPDELFYMSPILNARNYPILNSDGSINQTNLDLWNKFSESVSQLNIPASLPNEVATIIQNLKNLSTKLNGTIQLNKTLANLKQAFLDSLQENPVDFIPNPEQFWEQTIKPQIVQASGASENIDDISGINDIQQSLLILSGITEGSNINQISGLSTFRERNLATGTNSSIGLTNVAGAGYNQLVKIAELDPATKGNYILSFSYKATTNSISQEGKLIIKNDNNQLSSAANASSLINSLDIFGRWEDASNVATLGSFENFIIQKNADGKFEVLVRVKATESIQNIEFLSQLDGVEGTIAQPSTFGILDVQATDTTTFRSRIDGASANTSLLIGSGIGDTTNIVSSIQFFGKYMSSVVNGDSTSFTDRKLEFYQGDGETVTLGLNYATSTLVGSNFFSYNPITIYQNGISTGNQQVLTLALNSAPSDITGQYDLYSDIRNQLPSSIDSSNFEEASTINLNSSFDSSSKFAKQSLTYFDRFYAVGNRASDIGYANIDLSTDINFISIPDITQKVFFEKPKSYSDSSVTSKESQFKAIESVDEESKTLSILASVYNQFSMANSGDFAGKNYDLGTQTIWTGTEAGTTSGYKDITTKSTKISGSANTIYNALNDNWKFVSAVINKLFNGSVQASRYDGSSIALAQTVVENWLANVTPFSSANNSQIEQVINDSISIIKKDSSVNDSITESTNYDSLSSDTKNSLANQLVKLIKLQFGSIDTEFQSSQTNQLYDQFKQALSSTETSSYNVFNSASDLFEIYEPSNMSGAKLIQYKSEVWTSAASTKTTTLKAAVQSLFEVLYFSNGDGKNPTFLATSIFNATETLDAFNSFENATSIISFDNDTVKSKQDKIAVFNRILTVFAGSDYDLQKIKDAILKSGEPASTSSGVISQGFAKVLSNIAATNNTTQNVTIAGTEEVSSYYLDNIIAGTNIVIGLNWKLNQLVSGNSSSSSYVLNSNTTLTASSSRASSLESKIQAILNTNYQANPNELGIWSNIINDTYNFTGMSSNLSGREGSSNLADTISKIISDEAIMKSRVKDDPASKVMLEKILKTLWWIIIALIGVGVLVAAVVGVSTKGRQVKLSGRPVIKWLLIAGIILGIAVAAIAIIFGITIGL